MHLRLPFPACPPAPLCSGAPPHLMHEHQLAGLAVMQERLACQRGSSSASGRGRSHVRAGWQRGPPHQAVFCSSTTLSGSRDHLGQLLPQDTSCVLLQGCGASGRVVGAAGHITQSAAQGLVGCTVLICWMATAVQGGAAGRG